VRLRVGSRSVRYGNRSPNTGTRAVEAAVAGGAQRQAVRRRSEVVLVPRPRVEVGGVRRLAAAAAAPAVPFERLEADAPPVGAVTAGRVSSHPRELGLARLAQGQFAPPYGRWHPEQRRFKASPIGL